MKIWCLHGAVGMCADWDLFAQHMGAQDHDVRAIDLWSYLSDEGCGFSEIARALCAEAAGEDERPVLAGYSLGGRLALHTLLEADRNWRAAVIVSAHPGLPAGDERARIERMAIDAEWAARALVGGWDEFLCSWQSQSVLQGEAFSGMADRALLEPRRQAIARGFMDWSLGKQADLRPKFAGVAIPVLWVTGEDDARYGDLAAEAVSLLPRGTHRVIAGAGHRVPWEVPAEFAGETARFLEGAEPS